MLPTHEPERKDPAYAPATQSTQSQQGRPQEPVQEILGNTNDPLLRISCSSVPSKKALMSGGLPFGLVSTPFADGGGDPNTWLRRAPERCHKCGAYRNLYVSVEVATGRWACNFCGGIAACDDLRGAQGLEHKELKDAVVHFAEGGGGGLTAAGRPPCVHVFVVDTTVRARDLQSCKEDVVAAVNGLPPGDTIALIAFDGVVRIYDLTYQGAGRARVMSGQESPSKEELNRLGASGASLVSEVPAAAANFAAIVAALRPPVREAGRRRCKLRCLGPAVEVAVAIAGGCAQHRQRTGGVSPPGGSGHVVVCLGAEPSVGPGAFAGDMAEEGERESQSSYFALVGERARRLGVQVDVFVASLVGVGAGALLGMAQGSGGTVVSHAGFGDAMRTDMVNSSRRGAGSSGVVDVMGSHGVAVTRIIGPLVPPSTREESEMGEELPNMSVSPSVEMRNGYTVCFELEEDAAEEYVYLQLTVAFTAFGGDRVLRVSTVRLPVTSNIAHLLQGVDVETAAVIMAKEATMDVVDGLGVEASKQAINARLQNIAKTWGDQVKVTASGRVNVVPAQLSRLPYLTFHLLHGPLLGPILNHPDDYAVIRALFLRVGVDDGVRMLAPTLLMCPQAEGGQYAVVPLEDLSLLPDNVLLLDHHTHVFVWSGSKVAGPEFDGVRAAAKSHAMHWASGRFPSPEVLSFNEGDSMARWLICRLDPAHRVQGGGGIMGAVRGFINAQFVPTDDDSMAEWMAKLRLGTAQ